MVDVRAVLVADVAGAVGPEHERLGVERQPVVAAHRQAAAEDGGGQHAGSAGRRVQARGVQPAAKGGVIVGEFLAAGVGRLDLVLRGHFRRHIHPADIREAGVRRKGEAQLSEARAVIREGHAGIVAAVGQRVENSAVGGDAGFLPIGDGQTRDGAEGVAEGVQRAGGNTAHADEAVVDEGGFPDRRGEITGRVDHVRARDHGVAGVDHRVDRRRERTEQDDDGCGKDGMGLWFGHPRFLAGRCDALRTPR